MLQFLTVLSAQTTPEIFFAPAKFVENLKYMGIGMLVIFTVIAAIILATMIINYLFSDR